MNKKNETAHSLNVLKGCTLETNCITLQDGQTAKICVENGKTKIMIENKEVKEEDYKFKKGDILSHTEGYCTWMVIFKGINESKDANKLEYYCMLNSYKEVVVNAACDEIGWHYATEEEKRTLFQAMLKQGMFWDENKMKVRTLKDGDIITIKAYTGEYWQSIFKEIKDGKVYSYSDLDCDKKLYKGPFGEVNVILAIRYATTEERQTLFDKIEEQKHQKWNAETKEFEDIRWRAKTGEQYWFINAEGRACSMIDSNFNFDNNIHSFGNYFQTKELAEAAAGEIKELLSKL